MINDRNSLSIRKQNVGLRDYWGVNLTTVIVHLIKEYPVKRETSLLIDNRREYLRGQGDQCYGPSTNSSWKEPQNMRGGGFGTVRMDQNGCVGTTPPERMNTNYNVGQGRYSIENSHSMMFPINYNASRNQTSIQTNTQIKDKKPPYFDGTGNGQDFLVQFEMVAAVNKWDDNSKAFELATSLRGVAQGVVTEIEPLRRFDYNYPVSSLTFR
ncbi:unnamed protein product [Mytilus coruscus]|uniref:Uncharacterized protein n=1 Tax=Mytilus coruscus TaxID=42192 RepID=A0A6J8CM01_MYTCO|nr:unnamed protein product [Mytilus coruscus]